MKTRTFFLTILLAAACLCAAGCIEKSPGEKYIPEYKDAFEGCTPLFKGTSTAFGVKCENLTLYKTNVEKEYFIPYFFDGAMGELDFFWDTETGEISMENTFTGLFNLSYPIYVLDQKEYESIQGANAQSSYFDKASGTFTFSVAVETADGDNSIVRSVHILEFKITEIL